MKFTAERTPLIAAIKRASGVIQSRNTTPALACVLITATDTGVKFYASNLNEWAAVDCVAAVSGAGEICVNAKALLEWLNTTPKGALVGMELTGHRAVLTAGRFSISFTTFSRSDFPASEAASGLVEVAGIIPALAQCVPYAAIEEVRYYLRGVAINAGHAVATDGHRLCVVDVRCDPAIEAILPNEALRQITQSGPDARLFVGPTQWVCEDDGARIGGQLIDGTFPDWQRIVPKIEATSEIDTDALASAIASVSVADDGRVRRIKIKGDGAELILQTQGSAASAEAIMSYDGVAFEFGVNVRYAATALATFAGHVVRIGVDGNMSAWACDGMPDLRVCVMGMRI